MKEKKDRHPSFSPPSSPDITDLIGPTPSPGRRGRGGIRGRGRGRPRRSNGPSSVGFRFPPSPGESDTVGNGREDPPGERGKEERDRETDTTEKKKSEQEEMQVLRQVGVVKPAPTAHLLIPAAVANSEIGVMPREEQKQRPPQSGHDQIQRQAGEEQNQLLSSGQDQIMQSEAGQEQRQNQPVQRMVIRPRRGSVPTRDFGVQAEEPSEEEANDLGENRQEEEELLENADDHGQGTSIHATVVPLNIIGIEESSHPIGAGTEPHSTPDGINILQENSANRTEEVENPGSVVVFGTEYDGSAITAEDTNHNDQLHLNGSEDIQIQNGQELQIPDSNGMEEEYGFPGSIPLEITSDISQFPEALLSSDLVSVTPLTEEQVVLGGSEYSNSLSQLFFQCPFIPAPEPGTKTTVEGYAVGSDFSAVLSHDQCIYSGKYLGQRVIAKRKEKETEVGDGDHSRSALLFLSSNEVLDTMVPENAPVAIENQVQSYVTDVTENEGGSGKNGEAEQDMMDVSQPTTTVFSGTLDATTEEESATESSGSSSNSASSSSQSPDETKNAGLKEKETQLVLLKAGNEKVRKGRGRKGKRKGMPEQATYRGTRSHTVEENAKVNPNVTPPPPTLERMVDIDPEGTEGNGTNFKYKDKATTVPLDEDSNDILPATPPKLERISRKPEAATANHPAANANENREKDEETPKPSFGKRPLPRGNIFDESDGVSDEDKAKKKPKMSAESDQNETEPAIPAVPVPPQIPQVAEDSRPQHSRGTPPVPVPPRGILKRPNASSNPDKVELIRSINFNPIPQVWKYEEAPGEKSPCPSDKSGIKWTIATAGHRRGIPTSPAPVANKRKTRQAAAASSAALQMANNLVNENPVKKQKLNGKPERDVGVNSSTSTGTDNGAVVTSQKETLASHSPEKDTATTASSSSSSPTTQKNDDTPNENVADPQRVPVVPDTQGVLVVPDTDTQGVLVVPDTQDQDQDPPSSTSSRGTKRKFESEVDMQPFASSSCSSEKIANTEVMNMDDSQLSDVSALSGEANVEDDVGFFQASQPFERPEDFENCPVFSPLAKCEEPIHTALIEELTSAASSEILKVREILAHNGISTIGQLCSLNKHNFRKIMTINKKGEQNKIDRFVKCMEEYMKTLEEGDQDKTLQPQAQSTPKPKYGEESFDGESTFDSRNNTLLANISIPGETRSTPVPNQPANGATQMPEDNAKVYEQLHSSPADPEPTSKPMQDKALPLVLNENSEGSHEEMESDSVSVIAEGSATTAVATSHEQQQQETVRVMQEKLDLMNKSLASLKEEQMEMKREIIDEMKGKDKLIEKMKGEVLEEMKAKDKLIADMKGEIHKLNTDMRQMKQKLETLSQSQVKEANTIDFRNVNDGQLQALVPGNCGRLFRHLQEYVSARNMNPMISEILQVVLNHIPDNPEHKDVENGEKHG